MCVQDAFAKCPPLCLTLKVFLQHRELNDVRLFSAVHSLRLSVITSCLILYFFELSRNILVELVPMLSLPW